jgi:hypothetical protein
MSLLTFAPFLSIKPINLAILSLILHNRNHQQTVEAYGIFSIGEMIGRRNIVGYKLKD